MTSKQSKRSKIVIADSTPLIVLGNAGYLHILRDLFDTISIPVAVFSEVTVKMDLAAKSLVNSSEWIKVCQLPNELSSYRFHLSLDQGEKEAIALAISENADLILIDETKARKEAMYQKISCIGTIGILILAKSNGIICEIKPVLDLMIRNGMHISQEVYELALQAVNEL